MRDPLCTDENGGCYLFAPDSPERETCQKFCRMSREHADVLEIVNNPPTAAGNTTFVLPLDTVYSTWSFPVDVKLSWFFSWSTFDARPKWMRVGGKRPRRNRVVHAR